MRIFKNIAFHRWVKEAGLLDSELKKAVDEISNGLYEANLGGMFLKSELHCKDVEKVQEHVLS